MTDSTSKRLVKNIPKIMNAWATRANVEVKAAHHQQDLALKNSLPQYLKNLSDALSKTINRTRERIEDDKKESTRVSQKHGRDRAGTKHYTMEQLISEYQILRQVICEVMEKEAPLTSLEREVIIGSIEQAVNDAASEFSASMRNLQEQIARSLAHDLRTPITVARMAAEFIIRRPGDQAFHLDKAAQICNNLDRANKMISDILDISRIQAGEGVTQEFKECNLDEIIKAIAKEFNVVKKGKILVQSSGDCIGYWYADGLRRVIENLITNAIKYGLENSPINISLSQDIHSATIIVHNEGKTIPEEEIKILFQQFKRSESTQGKVGWGLGLTIVQSMVEAHEGTVKVESNAENGTSFMIHLPKTLTRKTKSKSDYINPLGPRDAIVNH